MVHKHTFFAGKQVIWAWFLPLFLLLSLSAGVVQAQAFNILAGAPAPASADPAVVQTAEVRAELLLDAPAGWQPGQPVRLGLHLQHSPEWHTYWRNPGDSGAAITLAWQLPAGSRAGAVSWPLPERIPVLDMLNYGYADDVVLSVPVEVETAAAAGSEVHLSAQWLVCRVECIPQSGEFRLRIPEQASPNPLVTEFLQRVPEDWSSSPTLRLERDGDTVVLSTLGAGLGAFAGQTIEVLAEEPQLIEHAAAGEQHWQGEHWQWRVPLNTAVHTAPERSYWVLSDGVRAVRLQAETADVAALMAWPTLQRNLQGMAVPAALQAALEASQAQHVAAATPQPGHGQPGLWAALGLAFVGGLILNLMPCVFPVLAIKALALLQSGHQRVAARRQAWAYTAGVLLSFVALAALLLVFKAAGAAMGWGFQLQSPGFLVALALLFGLLALHLAGGWQLSGIVPQSWLNASSQNATVNSFFTGILAVVVASPCTAPFMGAALGYALSQSAVVALLVFVALGLGLAAPFLLLAYVPAFGRWLPKPGAWMDALKRLLAVPLFLTVVWLLWVLAQQIGLDGAMLLLAALLLVLAAVWLGLGLGYRKSALLLLLVLLAAGWHWRDVWQSPELGAMAAPNAAPTSDWQAWSPERERELQAAGQPYFIDYTAAWCVTCQYNKRTVLHTRAVAQALAAAGVTPLRADWTRYDSRITDALHALGRQGVPAYVLVDGQGQQQLLPELLTTDLVLAAIASAVPAATKTAP